MGRCAGVNKIMRRFISDDTMSTLEKKYNQFWKKLDKLLYRFTLKEQSYGEKNPDKKFYIIGKEVDNWGILTSYTYFMQECKWAVEHKYIPIIDLKNYFMPMSQDQSNAYKENAWDYYFRQPYPEYTLDEVYASKYVVKGNYDKFAETFNEYGIRTEDISRLGNFVKQRMNFQPYLWERAKKFLGENVPSGKKVLAINMRANFLWGQLRKEELYNNHPVSLSVAEYIELAEHYLKKWNCDYLFVATDDREWSEEFQTKFGEKCLRLERPLQRWFKDGQPVKSKQDVIIEFEKVGNTKRTEDYLTEVCITVLCDCLLSTITSVSNIALLHNNSQYEHVEIINRGIIYVR